MSFKRLKTFVRQRYRKKFPRQREPVTEDIELSQLPPATSAQYLATSALPPITTTRPSETPTQSPTASLRDPEPPTYTQVNPAPPTETEPFAEISADSSTAPAPSFVRAAGRPPATPAQPSNTSGQLPNLTAPILTPSNRPPKKPLRITCVATVPSRLIICSKATELR